MTPSQSHHTKTGGEPDEKIRLANPHRWTLYTVTFLVWISGTLWLFWKNPWASVDPAMESSWPPLLMKIHGAAAMAILIILGSMLLHVRRGLSLKRGRSLGLFLIFLFLFLTITGWFLYYLGDDHWRDIASIVHWAVGLGLPLILAVHILWGRKVPQKLKHRMGLGRS